MFTLAFFAGLRGSEYTGFYINSTFKHVQIGQVKFSNTEQGLIMYYTVCRSKTQAHGTTIPLGCTGKYICPVCMMSEYLKLRLVGDWLETDPLFLLPQSGVVTKKTVDSKIKQVVGVLGFDPTQFSTHSIRSGAASTAASLCFSDWEIKRNGGRKSGCYRKYIRNMDKYVVGFSARLMQKN